MQTKHIIQIDDLSRSDIEEIFALAEYYLQKNKNKIEQKHVPIGLSGGLLLRHKR